MRTLPLAYASFRQPSHRDHHIVVIETRKRAEEFECLLVGHLVTEVVALLNLVKHGGIEQLADSVAGSPIGISAAGQEPESEVREFLLVIEAGVNNVLKRLCSAYLDADVFF
jgi:hypothetical protein